MTRGGQARRRDPRGGQARRRDREAFTISDPRSGRVSADIRVCTEHNKRTSNRSSLCGWRSFVCYHRDFRWVIWRTSAKTGFVPYSDAFASFPPTELRRAAVTSMWEVVVGYQYVPNQGWGGTCTQKKNPACFYTTTHAPAHRGSSCNGRPPKGIQNKPKKRTKKNKKCAEGPAGHPPPRALW